MLRYNKRYINGPGKVDPKVDTVKMADTLADARTALVAARTNKRVDPDRIYLYGWSEGTQIASAVAAEDRKIAGLILQGPVAVGFREGTLASLDSKIKFAESFSSAGKITAEGLTKALAQTNGWWAYDLVDTAKTDGIVVNPFFDDNKDGVLDIEHEVRANLAAFVESQIAGGGIIGDIAAFPSVADQASKLRLPMLVLNGTQDALTPPPTVAKLYALFAGGSYTRKEYPGLGHSLGTAASDIDIAGQFRPIDAAPLNDLTAWLGARTASTVQPPPHW